MRKTILLLAVAGLMLIASTGRAWAYSETDTDTWLGLDAAHSLAAGDYFDTFIGFQLPDTLTPLGPAIVSSGKADTNTTGAQ